MWTIQPPKRTIQGLFNLSGHFVPYVSMAIAPKQLAQLGRAYPAQFCESCFCRMSVALQELNNELLKV
ncbi:hypothetical protein TUM16664_03210 [Enterobacter cloacae]|nr:hypothetical protein TUM16664_03210 [Enterobacter cloacae]